MMPAVALKDSVKSAVYLASFCASSIVVMGALASAYGEATMRMQRVCDVGFGCTVFSASLSLIVGVLWLVLLQLGILEDIFG